MVEDYRIVSDARRPTATALEAATSVEYKIRLIQNLDENGKLPSVDFPLNQPENTQILAFNGKTKEIPITFHIYDNGNDKAAGSLPLSNIRDKQLSIGSVAAIPDSSTLRIEGDVVDRIENNFVPSIIFFEPGIEDSTGDAFIETADFNVFYDSSNDETVLENIEYDVQPSVGDEVLHSVVTVEEQIRYLQRHIYEGQFGAEWVLKGGRFDDPEGFEESDGTPVSIDTLNIRETADNPLRAEVDMKLKVGEIIP